MTDFSADEEGIIAELSEGGYSDHELSMAGLALFACALHKSCDNKAEALAKFDEIIAMTRNGFEKQWDSAREPHHGGV